METTALYIGYCILGILGFALIAAAIFVLYLTVLSIHRIITTKQTIRFMRRADNQATYDGAKAALDFLRKQKFSDSHTLKYMEEAAERFRKRHLKPKMKSSVK